MSEVQQEADALMYKALRIESRELLGRLGVQSNPGFSNANIIDGLRCASGLDKVETIPDTIENGTVTDFAQILGATLEEIGVPIPQPFDELHVLEAIKKHG